ncbi:MAG TPA: MltA domain-containing protein [Micropepsaceae bacterium]|nr:MltA domain-containing protein [Micropepsaceae bacterium]
MSLLSCVTPPKAPPPPPPAPVHGFELSAIGFDQLEGWAGADPEKALEAFRRSCTQLLDKAADAPLGGAGYAGTVADWEPPCRQAASVQPSTPDGIRAFFEAAFVPYRISEGHNDGLFTGYYEPELKGSRTQHGPYQTPLYGVPPDLVHLDMGIYRDTLIGRMAAQGMMMGMVMRFVPYPARAEIEQEGVPATPLFYVDDSVDAFFLQIQGSGRVVLDDGTVVRAAYAGQNGQPYTAIGAILLARGELTREEISAQSIRAWLLAHPEEAREVMDANASYVFFAERPVGDPTLGATGAEGVPLTPAASLAVDRAVHPLGVPVWLEGSAPDLDPVNPDRRWDALLVAQDTGGAIKGVVRADVYWGYGADAGSIAGRMKHPGRMNVLLPRRLAAKLGRQAQFASPR